MNKLLVSDNISLNDGSYELEINSSNLDILIKGDVKLYLINSNIEKLNITLDEYSILYLYKFNKNINNNLEVNIKQNNNSNLNYNEAFISSIDHELIINNYINGDNNNSNINIRNISNSNDSKVIINVDIRKNTKNNIALEDLKGVNNGGYIHIEPNIICESNEVVANHLTTIGSLNKESLDYLNSKGISIDDAKELLLRGFIYSNMDDYIKN